MTTRRPHSTEQSQLIRPKYRADVDGLRGLAILAVIGFHAFPDSIRGGFVGVDIFFVISGFLISTIILGSLDAATFSFKSFYARRIRRIFPALVLVLTACYIFGWFALWADEYKQLGKHIAAGVGFVSNFILWNEAGYFDNSAETKPLLHLWSLGIEEQFYIVWPFIIYAAWKRRLGFLWLTILVLSISFLINVGNIRNAEIGTFFSPVARFWELMIGGVLAHLALYQNAFLSSLARRIDAGLKLVLHRSSQDGNSTALGDTKSFIGFALIAAAVLVLDKTKSFPGWWALLPTVGTYLIISAGPKAFLNRTVFSAPLMVWFGLIGYPLYLWHWPLLTFARIVESGTPTQEIRIGAVLISIFLAWLTFKLIETPIHFNKGGGRSKVILLCLMMAALGIVGYGTYKRDGFSSRPMELSNELDWPFWENSLCTTRFGVDGGWCQSNSDKPKVMILGDSHGNHLYPGLAFTEPLFEVLAYGGCPPLDGVSVHVLKNQDKHFCASSDYLQKNKEILKRNPDIKLVVIAASWRPNLTGEFTNARKRDVWGGIKLVSSLREEAGKNNFELVFLGLSRTIRYLEAQGLKVVLIRDTPDLKSDFREYCKLRRFSYPTNCAIPVSEYLESRNLEDNLLQNLKREFPSLLIFDPIESLCDTENCYFIRHGEILSRDHHHLSVAGSRHLASDMKKWLYRNSVTN